MDVVYTCQDAPKTLVSSIFLAGPTPRDPDTPSWRPNALRLLSSLGYDGVVFVPEYKDEWPADSGYDEQVKWEERHLTMADVILFWVPRDIEGGMPAFTTNIEWGKWQAFGKCILGFPEGTDKMRYLTEDAKRLHIPCRHNLLHMIGDALDRLGQGAQREGAERFVPLHIWQTGAFQAWYKAQKGAGNRLEGARLLWRFGVGPQKAITFCFALHVEVWIEAEQRIKANEFILGRPDISATVAYRRGSNLLDTEVVLVREFRSPAATEDGFIRELPGGSSFEGGDDLLELASDEFCEETGYEKGAGCSIEPLRFKYIGARQVAGTLSTHKAHLFAVEMDAEEMDWLRSQADIAHGVGGDSERTFVEIYKVGDLLASDHVDWSNLGMILAAFLGGG